MKRQLLITLAALALELASLRGSTATIDVVDPRPIAQAVQTLVSKYGYVITYEDPRYNYEGDLEDVTDRVRRGPARPGVASKIMVPAIDKITVSLPATSAPKDVAYALGLLAQQPSRQGGHFRVERGADVFHVVPTEVRDKNGNWSANPSILDAPISLPAADYSELGMIRAICNAVGAANNVQVHVGVGFGRRIRIGAAEPLYHLEANNETARTVLLRALSASSPTKRTWLLFYDFTVKAYALNILQVPDVRSVPQPRSVITTPQRTSTLTGAAAAPVAQPK